MSITAKPLGLHNHLMNRSIGHSPLGNRSPLGVSSDWIQTFPVLQLSLEQSDRLSQNEGAYNGFDFSTAERTTSEEPRQGSTSIDSASTNIESQPIQAKEISESFVIPDAETDPAPTQVTEILSSQIDRLPLAPPEPLGNRPVLDIVSQRSTTSNSNIADAKEFDRSRLSKSIETPVKTTPPESVEHSAPDLPSQSEDTTFEELPTPTIQRLIQTEVESDMLPLSAASSEVGKLAEVPEHSVSNDVEEAHSIQLDREPNFATPGTPIEAITATITQPLSEPVESESTIDAKPNDEETTFLEVNSLDGDVSSDRASVSDQLVSPKPSNNTISSLIEPPQANKNEQRTFNNPSHHSAEINLKPDSSTQINASEPTDTEDLGTTSNKETTPQSEQLISPFEPTSSSPDIVSLSPLDSLQESSERLSEAVIQPSLEQSNSSEDATQTISPAIETIGGAESVKPISVTQIISPAIEPEPIKLTADPTPKISRLTILESASDLVETPQTNADAPTIESSDPASNLAQIEAPVNLSSSNINSEKLTVDPTGSIQPKLENIPADSRKIIARQNISEATQIQKKEPSFQTLPPLGMIQPLASDRTITPPSISPIYPQEIEPSQKSLSQSQEADQPSVSEISSLTIAQSSADSIQDSSSLKESTKTDKTPDSWSTISDLLNQSSTRQSEEKSTVSQERSWQDVADSLTDISETPTIQRDLQEFTEGDYSINAPRETASSETMIHLRSLEQNQPEAIAPTSPQQTSPKNSTTDDEQLEQLAWTVYHQLRQRLALDCERQGQLTHHPPWIEVVTPASPKITQSSTNDQSITNTIEMLSPTDAKLSQLTGEVYYRVRSRLEVDRERYGRVITKI